jgi:uncharacterized protein with GYD domain
LWNFTEQGVKSLKNSLQSIGVFIAYIDRQYGAGAHRGSFYSFGSYDAISLVEADDDNYIRYSLSIAEKDGNIRSTTLKSITLEEAMKFAETI